MLFCQTERNRDCREIDRSLSLVGSVGCDWAPVTIEKRRHMKVKPLGVLLLGRQHVRPRLCEPGWSFSFLWNSCGRFARTSDATQLYLHDLGFGGPYGMWDGDGNRHYFGHPVSGYDDPRIAVYANEDRSGRKRDCRRYPGVGHRRPAEDLGDSDALSLTGAVTASGPTSPARLRAENPSDPSRGLYR